MSHRLLRLSSGLELAYALHGKGARKAVFFHGHPGSRHQAAFLEPHLEANGLEVLSFDRYGYGNSAPETAHAKPLHLATEVEALADAAGFKKFHLIAVSGGAPYALRVAAELGKRVLSAEVVCGLGPINDPECAPHFPKALVAVMKVALATPDPLLSMIVRAQLRRLLKGAGKRRPPFLSPADFELLATGNVRLEGLRTSLEAAFRQGVQGSKRDLRGFLAPWELDWREIRCPVRFHHGLDDRLVPWQFSEILSRRIPGARFVPYKEEGHYTLPIRRAGEILRGIEG